MTPRRLPLRPDTITFRPPFAPDPRAQITPVRWRRKAFAVALHLACLALFGLAVVWPLVLPIAKGELAREFKPVLQVWHAWTSEWSLQALESWAAGAGVDAGRPECEPVCLRLEVR